MKVDCISADGGWPHHDTCDFNIEVYSDAEDEAGPVREVRLVLESNDGRHVWRLPRQSAVGLLGDIIRAELSGEDRRAEDYIVLAAFDAVCVVMRDVMDVCYAMPGRAVRDLLADALGLDVNELDYGWAEGIEDEEEES